MSCALVFFFKQKTSYDMRISDWSSDVCSSDLCNVYQPVKLSATSPTKAMLSFSANDRRSDRREQKRPPMRGKRTGEDEADGGSTRRESAHQWRQALGFADGHGEDRPRRRRRQQQPAPDGRGSRRQLGRTSCRAREGTDG